MTVKVANIENDSQTLFYKNDGGVWTRDDEHGELKRQVEFTFAGTTIRLVLKRHRDASMNLSRSRTLATVDMSGVALATWAPEEGATVILSFPTLSAPVPPSLCTECTWSFIPRLSPNKPAPLNIKVKIRRPA